MQLEINKVYLELSVYLAWKLELSSISNNLTLFNTGGHLYDLFKLANQRKIHKRVKRL